MGIKDIYNSIGKKASEIKGKLSDYFGPIKYNRDEYLKSNQQINQQPINSVYNLKDRGVKITDADIEAFRPLLYGEASNRDYNKKKLEADVIFNTAINRQREYERMGRNKTLSEVLSQPNQYQAYNSPQYKEYSNITNPISAAKKKEIDAIIDDIKRRVKSGEFKDNTEGAYFYIHNSDESITYDNLKPLFKE